MLGSVKAELEEARVFVEDDEVYFSLKYKNAKMEDGRIVRVWYPKIRLPIPTNALPEVKESCRIKDSWLEFTSYLPCDRLEIIPTTTTITDGLGDKTQCNDGACIIINQEVTLTEDEVMKILEEKYRCPVDIIKKKCATCRHRNRYYDEFPCNKCNELHLREKGEFSDED